MATRALWAAALIALAVAAVLTYRTRFAGDDETTAALDDREGDVVGTASPATLAAIDVTRAEVVRTGDDLVARITMLQPIEEVERPEGAVTFRVRIIDNGRTYTLRARLSGGASDAMVIDSSEVSRPYVLDGPRISGRVLEMRAPTEALPEVEGAFTWGAHVTVPGGEDKVPYDLAAVFRA